MTPLISVIICTYNRKKLLQRLLKDLVCQTIDRPKYDVVIVDNGSTDGTLELIDILIRKYRKIHIDLILEKKLGLGYARNIGVKKARGQYIAFLDDDSRISKNYLEKILACFNRVKPTPLVVGGKIIPLFDSRKPSWFREKYGIVSFGNSCRYLKKGESFSGPNMIFQKKVFEEFGEFYTKVGMRGESISVGEETSLFEKIWHKKGEGNFFYYSPDLVVNHYLLSYKTNISYQLKRYFASGQSWHLRHQKKYFLHEFILCFEIIIGICFYSFKALLFLIKYKKWQNWIVECWEKPVTFLGALVAILGIEVNLNQKRNA